MSMSSFLNLVLRENLCDSPFVSSVPQKRIAPAVGAALIGGGVALANGIGSLVSQADTNKTNEWIAKQNAQSQRETNEMNYRIAQEGNRWNQTMMREQNEFNERMYERQLYENSPQRQVELLKAAGLNPASQFGNVTPAGQLSSADAKSYERAQMVAPQLNYRKEPLDFSGVGNSVGSAINTYMQTKMLNANVKNTEATTQNINVQTEKERKSMQSYLNFLEAQSKKEGIQGEIARRELSFFNDSYQARLDLLHGDGMIQRKNLIMLDKQIEGVALDNTLKEIQNAFQNQLNEKQLQQMDATLSQIHAQIGLINANKLLTDEQRLHEIEKKVGQTIENGLKGIDFKIKEETKDYVMNDVKNRSYILGKEAKNWVSGERLRRLTSIIPFTSQTSKALF